MISYLINLYSNGNKTFQYFHSKLIHNTTKISFYYLIEHVKCLLIKFQDNETLKIKSKLKHLLSKNIKKVHPYHNRF